MLMTVFTVTMLALTVIMIMIALVIVLVMMVVVNRMVAVVIGLKAECHSSLVPGCHVEPVLLLQLSPGLVPLSLQMSQSSTDKLLL